jgi:hypothetical protein
MTHASSLRSSSAGAKKPPMALALLLAAALLLLSASRGSAQTSPTISSVDPTSGKVNDTITIMGANLAKPHVSAVFLSDRTTDHKASVVQQSDDKIVMKVPQVAPGDYNVSIQVGNSIFIQPVRFTVQQ